MAVPFVPPKRPSAPPADRRGTAIGRYVVLDLLAQGGMGVVYSAFDAQLDRQVAIKVLHPHLLKGGDASEVRARLLQAMAASRIPTSSRSTTSGCSALAASHGDRVRAKTLAEEARDGAAGAPVTKPDRATIDEWLFALK